MKTKLLTQLPGIDQAIINLQLIATEDQTETPKYRVTGHTIQTVELTAEEIRNRFFLFEDGGENIITIVAKDQAYIELSEDTRHGVKGFRANRYELVNEVNERRDWDETALFFESLDQAFELFAHPVDSPQYEEGRRAARMRF
jgi:hypothetical protein